MTQIWVKHMWWNQACHHSPSNQGNRNVRYSIQFLYWYFNTFPSAGKFYYGLRIVTGSQPGAAASTRTVVLGLSGTEGTTGEITVDAKDGWILFTHTYFKKSTYDDLVIECDDNLGEIQVVQAGLRYSSTIMNPDWYIDFFTGYRVQLPKLCNKELPMLPLDWEESQKCYRYFCNR